MTNDLTAHDTSKGTRRGVPHVEAAWIDVREVASIRASSEEAGHAIVNAFSSVDSDGWRAAAPGAQLVTVRFNKPRDLARIHVVFESNVERTQEFTISWSARRGESHGEVVRQQFNFSPFGATREVEDYAVELRAVEALEIRLVPDISGGPVVASMKDCRLR
jgi:hypothetical protein